VLLANLTIHTYTFLASNFSNPIAARKWLPFICISIYIFIYMKKRRDGDGEKKL
jgi:hypothetical protein